MLFGGQSRSWIEEAVALLQRREDLLFVSPLSGPPHPEGLKGRHVDATHNFTPEIIDSRPAYRFRTVSTRIFLMDMARFKSSVGTLPLERPDLYKCVRAFLLGNPTEALSAEMELSRVMKAHDLGNMHFLGSGDGMYSLHPPFHFPAFHEALPGLIAQIERGDIPEGQLGDYDINNAMFDMTDARQQQTWRRRIGRRLKDVIAYWTARVAA
jgi:hypothetical protein